MAGNPDSNETIKVKRRRQGASSGPSGSGRAEMPGRPASGGSGGTGGGSYSGGGSGGSGSGGSGSTGGGLGGLGGGSLGKLPLWAVLLLVIGYFVLNMLGGGSDDTGSDLPAGNGDSEEVAQLPPTSPPAGNARPAATSRPAATARPTRTPDPNQAATTDQTWTVMLYQDADDRILEQDIYMDLNEAERVGSSERVQIVAQVDRFKGAYTGDGNWSSTRRYHVTRDRDLIEVNSELVDEIGEANMADGDTLTDFIVWAAENYPADKYVLILSDHGMGWPGGWSDPDPVSQDASRVPLASALGDDHLYMMEMEDALANALQQAGIERLEMVGMDACLMGHLEVLAGLEPYARYAVLSQETEPALGWAYTSFLQDLVDNPDLNGADLGERIVASYIQDDQRIQDDQARAEFLRQGSPLGGLFGSGNTMSAAALARQLEQNVTLSAIDLGNLAALTESVNHLAFVLQEEDQEVVAQARNYAPAFTNVFSKEGRSPYIDLGTFAQMLVRQGANNQTEAAVQQVIDGLGQVVLAEKHGDGKKGATGVSIYFPNSQYYSSAAAGAQSYTAIARQFASGSLWDDYLAYHYTGSEFDAQPAAPAARPGASTRAPGAGQIQVGPIELSSQSAAPNRPVTLTTTVSGSNIGYIYLFVGYYDQASNSIYRADMDYLESPDTREVNGVFYPVWSENDSFNLELDWEPTLFQVTDGETTTVAMFRPETYGEAVEETVYTVDGIYTYADGSQRSARLYFRDGVMRQVFGWTDENHTGGVREIIPEAGDSFTILDTWLDLDSSGQVTQTSTSEGETLTFGDQPFTWEEVFAAEGRYVLGIIVEDLDGNTTQAFTTINVQ